MKHEKILFPPCPAAAAELSGNALVLDLLTEGRFWRTSRITGFFLLYKEAGHIVEESFTPEKESDEYDLLLEAAKRLDGPGALITYNGDSFDLPHLRKKYAAYGLPIPFDRRTSLDLFKTLKPLADVFALPSRKLADFTAFLTQAGALVDASGAGKAETASSEKSPDGCPDAYVSAVLPSPAPSTISPAAFFLENAARQTLACLAFLPVLRFLEGGFSAAAVRYAGGSSLDIALSPRSALPFPFTLSMDGLTLTAKAGALFEAVDVTAEGVSPESPLSPPAKAADAKLTLPVKNGFVRRYFPDYKNYEYLPAEGYAIHKSVSAYVAASRKEPATLETCFVLVPAEKLLKDPEAAKAVAKSALEKLCSRHKK